jgi:proline iminopeptidase
MAAARAWTAWEMATSRLLFDSTKMANADEDKFALAFSRIESHFFVHGGWFKEDSQLLNNAHIIKDIPGVIVQGRYDVVCPATTAWELHKNWPKSELTIVPDAGHSMAEKGILSKLVDATDQYRTLSNDDWK